MGAGGGATGGSGPGAIGGARYGQGGAGLFGQGAAYSGGGAMRGSTEGRDMYGRLIRRPTNKVSASEYARRYGSTATRRSTHQPR